MWIVKYHSVLDGYEISPEFVVGHILAFDRE
jgi:hypothetical protein